MSAAVNADVWRPINIPHNRRAAVLPIVDGQPPRTMLWGEARRQGVCRQTRRWVRLRQSQTRSDVCCSQRTRVIRARMGSILNAILRIIWPAPTRRRGPWTRWTFLDGSSGRMRRIGGWRRTRAREATSNAGGPAGAVMTAPGAGASRVFPVWGMFRRRGFKFRLRRTRCVWCTCANCRGECRSMSLPEQFGRSIGGQSCRVGRFGLP